jgi:hypothetical protein
LPIIQIGDEITQGDGIFPAFEAFKERIFNHLLPGKASFGAKELMVSFSFVRELSGNLTMLTFLKKAIFLNSIEKAEPYE